MPIIQPQSANTVQVNQPVIRKNSHCFSGNSSAHSAGVEASQTLLAVMQRQNDIAEVSEDFLLYLLRTFPSLVGIHWNIDCLSEPLSMEWSVKQKAERIVFASWSNTLLECPGS